MKKKNKKIHDPLALLEKKKVSRLKSTIVFLVHYFALTGAVFAVLLFATNFSAYTNRVIYWISPESITAEGESIRDTIGAGTMEVQAASEGDDKQDTLESLTEKIEQSDPSLIYESSDSSARLKTNLDSDEGKVSFEVVPYENRIIIPRLGKNIPLVDVNVTEHFDFDHMENIFMEQLEHGVVRYPGTSKPGEIGNAFIFGHSSNYPWIKSKYNDVFALLDTLSPGDDIIVYYQQKSYTYRVKEKVVVKPGDVKALNGRDPNKKELSLMTCWPIGTDLNRMIVFSELVDRKTLAKERIEKLRSQAFSHTVFGSGDLFIPSSLQH